MERDRRRKMSTRRRRRRVLWNLLASSEYLVFWCGFSNVIATLDNAKAACGNTVRRRKSMRRRRRKRMRSRKRGERGG